MTTPASSATPQDEIRKALELKRMKRRATGLLILSVLVYGVASLFFPASFWRDLIRATSEAAVVGGLADWFAVTALFRHPLGLKIPHTAIIPMRKNQFGDRLGLFIQRNFLNGDVILKKLRQSGLAGRVAHLLQDQDASARLSHLASAGLAGIIHTVQPDEFRAIIGKSLTDRLETVPLTPALARFLITVLTAERRQALLVELLGLIKRGVRELEFPIREKISQETPWWIPVPIDEKVFRRLVEFTEALHDEIRNDPDHPLFRQYEELLDRFIDELRQSPAFIEKGEAFKNEFLSGDLINDATGRIWTVFQKKLEDPPDGSPHALQQPIQRGLQHVGETLAGNPELMRKIDDWLEEAIRYVMSAHGDEIGRLIAQTVHGWDGESTSRRIELHVGKDLQYIRINGTVVGGLAGLVLFLLSLLAR